MNVQNVSLRYLTICMLWVLAVFSSTAFGATEQVRISSDNDDAEELISDGDMYRDSTDLEFGYDDYAGGLQIVGMRFKSVGLPKGAIITSAYIEFETDETDSGTTTLIIVGEDGDSPKEFKNGKKNISKRTKTSASVNWAPPAWNSTNELHQTPDISTIIQEIVDRAGWAANNNLVLIVEPGTGCTSINCQRTAESHDGESSSAPQLVVNYTVGSSGSNLTGSMNVDNTFRAYISTDDSVQGALIGSGNNWPTTVDIATMLTEGQDYYLHVYATDVGGVAGFLGDFEITGTSHSFSNGLKVLDTNTSDWSVSTTGWENYLPASGYGLNGVSPWGNRSAVNGTAEWIWSSDNNNDNVNYFSAKISVPINRPLLEYRFDDCTYSGNAGDVSDTSANNYNGTSNGTIERVENAVINTGLDLSNTSTDNWVRVPNQSVDGLNDFSIATWFKIEPQSNKNEQYVFYALGKDDKDKEIDIHLHIEKDNKDDKVHVNVAKKGENFIVGQNLDDGNWHQLTLTRSGKDICLFIDNVSEGCSNKANADTINIEQNNAVVIGQKQNNFGNVFESEKRFKGQLDEFKVYGTKLSDTEINTLYQNELAGKNYDGTLRDPEQCDDQCDATPGLLNAVGIKIGSGSNSQINTTTEALAIHAAWLSAGSPTSGLIDGGTYNVAASGESTADRIDFGGSSHDFSGTLTYPGVGAGVSGSDFLVHTSGTLSLPAGNYTIYVEADDGFSFIMDTLSGDTVSFNKFGSSSSGQSNELRFENPTANSNTGGSFTLTEDSVFDIAAIFFERGGGDYLEISISNDIRSNVAPSGYEILKHGALGGKVKFGDCVDPSQIDHYQIIHDGNGLTCTAEEVIIKACTNTYDGTCTLSGEAVTIVVNTTGSDIATDTITFTGEGTANLAYTKSESTILSIEDASIIPASPAVCFDNSTTSCNLFFDDTGFRFYENTETNPIPTQVSAKPSNTLKIQAIEKNPDTGACQATFIDTTTIEMAATCVDPIACAGSQVAINNLITTGDITTLDKNSVLSYSSVNLDFSDNTVNSAEFIFTYPDAGKVQLHARYNIPDENGDPSGNYMLGSSNEFVVRPFGFFIDVVGNPKAETAGGTKFIAAGEEFSTILKAVQWQADGDTDLSNNQVTKNFGNEQAPETAKISPNMVLPNLSTLPSAGVLGNLTNVTFDTFSAGSSAEQGIATNDDMTYSEVGIISFNANLTDKSYLGADDVVGSEPYVGRFIPNNFEITNVIDGSLVGACSVGGTDIPFVYSGQMLSDSLTTGALSYILAPALTVTAKSSICPTGPDSCTTTQNYTGNFIKLSTSSYERILPISDAIRKGKDDTNLVALAADFDIASIDGVDGEVTYTYSGNDHYAYLHEANSEIDEFTSVIDLSMVSIIDSDLVETLDNEVDKTGIIVTLNPAGKLIRFGRAQLENSYGPETSNLPQSLSVNYFEGGQYKVADNDLCTPYNATNMTVTNTNVVDPLPLPLPTIKSAMGDFRSEVPPGITRAIELLAPGTGNTGRVCVSYEIYPWLQYKWATDEDNLQCPFVKADVDGLFNDNPRAVATFGIYRGNDRIIYQREISR